MHLHPGAIDSGTLCVVCAKEHGSQRCDGRGAGHQRVAEVFAVVRSPGAKMRALAANTLTAARNPVVAETAAQPPPASPTIVPITPAAMSAPATT